MHLQPICAATLRKYHQIMMRRGNEQLLDKIFLLGRHRCHTAPAAPLLPIGIGIQPLDIAAVGDGNHHILFRNQIFVRDLAFIAHNHGASCVAMLLAHLRQLIFDDIKYKFFIAQHFI